MLMTSDNCVLIGDKNIILNFKILYNKIIYKHYMISLRLSYESVPRRKNMNDVSCKSCNIKYSLRNIK